MGLAGIENEGVTGGVALVLPGQRSHEGVVGGWIPRCPTARLVHDQWFVCRKRTCPSCGPKRARETARMLFDDACGCDPPTHALTVTTVDVSTAAADFRRAWNTLRNRLRREGWRFDYYARVEFTTGRAKTSGGRRRIHAHAAVKLGDVAGHSWEDAERHVREAWQASTGAWRVELTPLRTPVGVLHYLWLHHAKASQLPPDGWRGMVDRPSRGYFGGRSVAEVRQDARDARRAEWLASVSGLTVADTKLMVALDREARSAARADLVALRAFLDEIEPDGVCVSGSLASRGVDTALRLF